jgi:hypothetical protein
MKSEQAVLPNPCLEEEDEEDTVLVLKEIPSTLSFTLFHYCNKNVSALWSHIPSAFRHTTHLLHTTPTKFQCCSSNNLHGAESSLRS